MIGLLILAAQSPLIPPAEFQKNNGAQVEFVSDFRLVEVCKNARAVACSGMVGDEHVIWVQNPCKVGGYYAAVLCHELGHVNGWPADHRKAPLER
jgi:hypothetical protein